MTRTELIEKGVAMFQQSCRDAASTTDRHGQTWWVSGDHRINQDRMTPVAVAFEVGHTAAKNAIRSIREDAEHRANLAAISIYFPNTEPTKP